MFWKSEWSGAGQRHWENEGIRGPRRRAGALTVGWGKGGVWTEAGEGAGKNGSRGGGDEEVWDRAQFLGILWSLGLKFKPSLQHCGLQDVRRKVGCRVRAVGKGGGREEHLGRVAEGGPIRLLSHRIPCE